MKKDCLERRSYRLGFNIYDLDQVALKIKEAVSNLWDGLSLILIILRSIVSIWFRRLLNYTQSLIIG